ncbi:MAG: hypothetical protein FJ288_09230 [Planctomycetes bacterium]|nr:hypothetical protein [Planctomycetota bacterium]
MSMPRIGVRLAAALAAAGGIVGTAGAHGCARPAGSGLQRFGREADARAAGRLVGGPPGAEEWR